MCERTCAVCECVHTCVGAIRGPGFPGAGVTGGCELPGMDAGKHTPTIRMRSITEPSFQRLLAVCVFIPTLQSQKLRPKTPHPGLLH